MVGSETITSVANELKAKSQNHRLIGVSHPITKQILYFNKSNSIEEIEESLQHFFNGISKE